MEYISNMSVRELEANLRSVSPKDALVLVHASWCGYCSSFRPMFEAAVRGMSLRERPMVFRIDDAQAQALLKSGSPEARKIFSGVTGFPTLMMVRGAGPRALDVRVFRRERTVEQVRAFIRDNVTSGTGRRRAA